MTKECSFCYTVQPYQIKELYLQYIIASKKQNVKEHIWNSKYVCNMPFHSSYTEYSLVINSH